MVKSLPMLASILKNASGAVLPQELQQ